MTTIRHPARPLPRLISGALLVALAVTFARPVAAALSDEELAKLAQNPVGNLISVPFQNNANLNYGPFKQTQDILNIQPVIPIDFSPDWNIITRTIIPVISQPLIFPGQARVYGIGPTQISAFLSPADPKNGLIWGVGAITQIPTETQLELGSDRWGAGPTFVILRLTQGSPWVYGVLLNNVWSFTNGPGGSYNSFLAQPFLNYNFESHKGTYLTTSPIITANWQAQGRDVWTVPVGGGIGHIFHLGRLPMNSQIAAYYNAATPQFGGNWQIRAQVQFMFPKSM
jgi:hypothetical protein